MRYRLVIKPFFFNEQNWIPKSVITKKNEFLDYTISSKLKLLKDYTPKDLDIEDKFCIIQPPQNPETKAQPEYVFVTGSLNLLERLSELRNISDKLDLLTATVHYISTSHHNSLGIDHPPPQEAM